MHPATNERRGERVFCSLNPKKERKRERNSMTQLTSLLLIVGQIDRSSRLRQSVDARIIPSSGAIDFSLRSRLSTSAAPDFPASRYELLCQGIPAAHVCVCICGDAGHLLDWTDGSRPKLPIRMSSIPSFSPEAQTHTHCVLFMSLETKESLVSRRSLFTARRSGEREREEGEGETAAIFVLLLILWSREQTRVSCIY